MNVKLNFLSSSMFQYQNGAVIIPKSANKDRIKSNIDIFDFELSQQEMEIIDSLNTNKRLLSFDHSIHDKNYPFGIEFWIYCRGCPNRRSWLLEKYKKYFVIN